MRHRDAPDRPARVLGYVRVSGREQGERGTSLEGQQDELRRFCAGRGYPEPIIRLEVESASPEKIEKRDELHGLIADARPGDLIVVCRVDRWSRDLEYGVGSVRKIVKRGVGWYSVGESIDATTSQGDSVLGIMAWAADQERKRIKERTVGRRAELRDQGLYVEGPAPYGYRRGSREERRQLLLELVPDEAAVVREAFERCLSESVERVRDWLEGETARAWDKKAAHLLLMNRVYLGEVKSSSGAWIPSTHTPAITRDLYERAQAAMAARKLGGRSPSSESRTATWLLRGLASCPDCGSRMGAQYSRSTDGGYYACARRLRLGVSACAAPYVPVDKADAAAGVAALAQLATFRRELARPRGAVAPTRKARDFGADRARLRSARERAVRLATDGTITREDLARELARLDQELGRLEVAAGAAARSETAQDPEARRAALADVERLERAWRRAPVEVRREALRGLAASIVLRPTGAEIAWRSADELAQEHAAAGAAHLFAPPAARSRKSSGKRRRK